MDSPTPAGFVADAEEALGKARAMRDQAIADRIYWCAQVEARYKYWRELHEWAAGGGTGPRPRKPQEPSLE